MPTFRPGVLALGLAVIASAPVAAQDSHAFGRVPVEVVSEWRGQDRGDGSGSYHLVTTVTDPVAHVAVQHELGSERAVDGDVRSTEAMRVLIDDEERFHGESDPAALGPWSITVTTWVLPFDQEFHPDPLKTYRPLGKRVTEVVRAAVPEAKVATRSGSDGRTSATVELAEPQPVDVLAGNFVKIREALREAELGLAKLVLKGSAVAPAGAAVSASPGAPQDP